ncbi:MAG: sulfatase-like hydrolase/transferase [Bacteroidales bacterium]|nr:sulfatase-like hydrolase/transferase [Bacteroidales bacterium]
MFDRFISNATLIFKFYLIFLFLFMVYRSIGLVAYANFNNYGNLIKAYTTGFKFDSIVTSYLLSFVLMLNLPYLFLNKKTWYDTFYTYTTSLYIQISLTLVVILLTIDFYYYRFFHNHFDSMFFGIVEDDTKAVLDSIWKDYPVIPIALFIIIAFIGIRQLTKNIIKKDFILNTKRISPKLLFVIGFIALFGIGMRGSLGTFPVGKDDMIICNDNSINDITPNPVFYLKETIADRSRYKITCNIEPILKKYKFNAPEEAIRLINSSDTLPDINCLLTVTPKNDFLISSPPNVIFILMESFSLHFLSLHSQSFNLLGELENQLKYCSLYRNFLSCANGTIHSFEGLLANTPTTPVSQSQYNTIPLKSAAALPFKQNNYSTLFLTGSKLNWRNLGPWAGKQYFDKIEGRETLISEIDSAKEGTWEVFDEFLFERVFDQLTHYSKAGRPTFIFGFTVTNHTPYEVPAKYKPFPLELSDSIMGIVKESKEYTWECFRNYQYSNHYLGLLIKKIRESEFGKNTIIAITGDHNCRNLFEYSDAEQLNHYGVPLILYVPEKYLGNSIIDTERFGSHKDIFPTLYNLSLSGAEYLHTGNNLLSADTSVYFYAVNNYSLGIDQTGAVNTITNLRYQWVPGKALLEPPANSQKLDRLYDIVRANSFCMDYFVRMNLSQNTHKNINEGYNKP